MAKQLTVKAVLQYPEGLELGSSPDVRRFKVDKGSDLYRRLVDTLPGVFPDIQGVDYSLFYKDEDGEMVEFSSMEELQIALDNMVDNVFRLFVIVNYEGAADDPGVSSSDTDGEAVAKRVRFTEAGKRLRKRIRRRRKAALSDQEVTPEYRKAVRLLLRRLHEAQKQGNNSATLPEDDQDKAVLASLSPEVKAFVQKVAEDWHTKLTRKRPRVVARRIRKEKRSFPQGMERGHFQWLCRHMARWHRRHAGDCDVMAGWSSGETGDDTSGDDEAMIRKIRKKRELKKREKAAKAGTTSASEDTDALESSDEKVSKDFRKDVRAMMTQLHKKKPADDTALSALSPEVKAFIQKMADDWHTKLAQKRPRFVAKKVKKENKKSLPAGLQKEAFQWLIKFFKRWHRRHAERCQAMAAWSSGGESGTSGDEKEKNVKTEKKEKKKEGKKDKKKEKEDEKEKSSSSSSSSSDDENEEDKDPVSAEFRRDIRVLVSKLHRKNKASKKGGKSGEEDEEEQSTPSTISPEMQAFVQQLVQDWHTKLSQKPPRAVARMMKKKGDNLPPGVDEDHFRWLRRFMARWHRRHAGKCDVMSGWSSGETADDTSADESVTRKRRAKKLKRLAKEKEAVSESEDTDCLEKACKPVSAEFRGEVRTLINQLHRKNKQNDRTAKGDDQGSSQLKDFVRNFNEQFHTKLALGKRPRGASNEAREEVASLPAGMGKEQLIWLACYVARWHRKHGDKCDVMLSLPLPGEKSKEE